MPIKINPIGRAFQSALKNFVKESRTQQPITKEVIRDLGGMPKKVIINGNQVYTYNGKEVIEETDGVLRHHHFSLWQQLVK